MMNRILHIGFTLLLLFLVIACGNKKVEFIEMERFTNHVDGRFHFRILIKNVPYSNDSLKKEMLQFYLKKTEYLQTIDSSYYIRAIRFYNKTRCTSYFIDHEEDHTGAFTDILNDCNDIIGTITVGYPCDSVGTIDWILLYKKTDTGISRISTDTLFYNCNGMYIDNWDKYK